MEQTQKTTPVEMERPRRSKYKQLYFYVEDDQYSCIVAIYKKNDTWFEGRIVAGKRPRCWGRGEYDTGIEAEERIKEKYDYVDFIKDSKYEHYIQYVNS